jgi:AcrR family transcriptional regulator
MSRERAPRRQHERTATTRRAILTTARELFARDGFEATTIGAIAGRAGVSKGALYHHFADKADVLAAVYEDLEQELVESLVAVAVTETDPVLALRRGCQAFLDHCLDPVFRRIALVDAPNGLGWQRWRSIDARHGFGLLLAGLRAAADQGRIRSDHLDERAHLLLAALVEAALLVGSSDDPAATRESMGALIDEHLDGLLFTPAGTPSRTR